jgi:hypothetical protein
VRSGRQSAPGPAGALAIELLEADVVAFNLHLDGQQEPSPCRLPPVQPAVLPTFKTRRRAGDPVPSSVRLGVPGRTSLGAYPRRAGFLAWIAFVKDIKCRGGYALAPLSEQPYPHTGSRYQELRGIPEGGIVAPPLA